MHKCARVFSTESVLPLFLFLTTGLLPAQQVAAAARPHVDVATVSPRPDDVASVDGIMKAFYEVISGPAGQPRQWSRDRTLYIADIRFIAMSEDKAGHPVVNVASHQEYVDGSDAFFLKNGFYETEIHRATQRFGNVVHVFSTYESRLKADGPVIVRGINSLELFYDGKRWWIASALWDDERANNPLPKEFLPEGDSMRK